MIVENKSLDKVLDDSTWIVGISYFGRREVAISTKVGDVVNIQRDYDNLVDRNAVKVLYKGKELGYLERNLAQFIAPYLDSGLKLRGVVNAAERGQINQIRLKLEHTPDS